ncbi:MAG: hypothetical protein JWL97_4545 [Gemmatimonadales bacterium]|nr:hypothetical protein [Gemmatimonadales bacterium]
MIHPEGLPVQWWSVVGCWAHTGERHAEMYEAVSARAAEDQAQMDARDAGGPLWVAGVVAGQIVPVDLYTAFVDPADPRNDGCEGLTPDFAALELTTYTVLGIARDPSDRRAYEQLVGERYADTVPAISPGAAEDVARSRLADKGGELWVVCVLEGVHRRADTYATFVDPEVAAR